LQQPERPEGVAHQVAKEIAMRGSTIDQVRHDIDHAHTDMKVSEQIDAAEKAAGLQPMHPPKPDESDHGLWFAVGAGISVATIAVAVALT
jgi:hypothetical protein